MSAPARRPAPPRPALPRAVPAALVPVLVAGALLGGAAPASAAACSGAVTYSSSTNTVRVSDAGRPWTLASVLAACPAAPLQQVDPARHVWELRGDLIVQGGATLAVSGSGTDPVAELRLQSLADGAAVHVIQLAADNATIALAGVHVRSWDDAANAPDTDTSVAPCPAGTKASACPRGRAFVRALASKGADGRWGASRLDVTDSEVDHLGFYAATTYGVSYKTESGCSHASPALCGHVSGSQVRSSFHDNYMGTYTWGAKGIAFHNSSYTHNVMYGLDPHDVSTDLDIVGNHMAYNGDHGLICSQACDHLTIVGNESDHNGLVPWRGPKGDDADGQVHGIMLHRGITGTVVRDNDVHDQPNGAGIAIFDTVGATLSGNTLARNRYGVRLSVGASGNTFTDTTITGSTGYGVYSYRGGDAPAYTATGGRVVGNTFDRTTIADSGSNPVKLGDADGTVFTGTTLAGASPAVYVAGGARNTFTGTTYAAGQRFSTSARGGVAGSLTVAAPGAPLAYGVDATSTVDVTGPTGALFSVDGRSVATSASATGSALRLSAAATGSGGTVRPQPVNVVPAAGTALASAAGSGTATTVVLQETAPAATRVSVGALAPGQRLAVLRAGKALTTATVDAKGVLAFTDTPPGTGQQTYTLAAAG